MYRLILKQKVPINPQGLATASGLRAVPFQLNFLFMSLLVTFGEHTSALSKSI